jgi:hypothetical protein
MEDEWVEAFKLHVVGMAIGDERHRRGTCSSIVGLLTRSHVFGFGIYVQYVMYCSCGLRILRRRAYRAIETRAKR